MSFSLGPWLALASLKKIPIRLPPGRDRTGRDAFAIHGRLGAQVALPQSLILPNAQKKYQKELENQL